MNPAPALLIGIVMIISVAWQIYLWVLWEKGDSRGKVSMSASVGAPMIVAATISLGVIVLGLTSALDSQNVKFTGGDFFACLFKAIILLIITAIKSLLGIVVAGYVVSSEIYFYHQYGQLRPVPIISSVLEWIFNFGPNWLGVLWLGIQVVWSIFTGSVLGFLKG